MLGCEVVAEIERCSTVYVIVTNYIEWTFYKNTDDAVYKCMKALALENNIPSKESISYIASIIFGMLTEISST